MYFYTSSYNCWFTHRFPGLFNIEWVTNSLTIEIKSDLIYIRVIVRESGFLERLRPGFSRHDGNSVEFPTECLPNTSVMHKIFLLFCYLATLPVSSLYSVDDGRVCDMIIGRGNRSTLRKTVRLSLRSSQVPLDFA
jgi:hypothetical protein